MPFADLETMSLRDYVAQEVAKESMWFFLHIPKTAGTSFSYELSSHTAYYYNIYVDYTDTTRTLDEKMALEVDKFIQLMAQIPFRSASSHADWPLIQKIIAARPDTRVISFLRSPEARLISEYRYRRTPTDPQYKDFIEEFPTLQSFVEDPYSHNRMTTHLWGERELPSPDELLQHVRMNFTFFGLMETYPMSFASIFKMMGSPDALPTEYRLKTPDIPETQVSITPALREMIRETNQLDQMIYDYVATVLGRHRDAFHVAQEPHA